MAPARARDRRIRRSLAGLTIVGALVLSSGAGYTVRAGDTLSGLAKRFGTTVTALARANDITDPDRIRVGQRLQIPGGAGAGASRSSASRTYRVRWGDSLSGIAMRHRVGLSRLARVNGITNPNRIYVGQVLHLPGAGSAGGRGGANGTSTTGRQPTRAADRARAGSMIERVAREWGWNPSFVKALAWQESGWQMRRVSVTGAVGIMQVMPGTGSFVSRALVGRQLDLHDAYDNVTAGVAFLDYLYELTGGDARLTLGGYYQGLRSIAENGVYPDTVRYIDNVLALKRRFR